MKERKKFIPENMLRVAKLRSTRGRVAILKILSAAKRPLTREQIASELGKKGLNKVTIYRALERFVRVGLVHRAFCTPERGILNWPIIAAKANVTLTLRAQTAVIHTA